jgi:inner membrane protein
MTGRTHDLAAFTALNLFLYSQPIPQMSLATALIAFGANMIGGLLPDIDDETSDIWDKIRGGNILSHIIHPLIGHHRMISHSILGMVIIGFILNYLLSTINKILLVDVNIVWWSIMVGYLSHLIMDSLTTEGVPWFFPIPFRFGFPPFKFLRIKTGGLWEKIIVFPGILLINGYLIATNYHKLWLFFRGMTK